jgi:hypothetical protein
MRAMLCRRPVFILRAHEQDLAAARAAFTLTASFSVVVGVGSPAGATPVAVYRVVAAADTCP